MMVLSDGNGTPLVAMTESATPNEVTLIEPMLGQFCVPKMGRGHPRTKLGRLIYEKGADSDPLRLRLLSKRTKLICPHRSNRVKPPMQDGRELRRYRRRWKIERTISWIQDFRRLVVRYDHKISMFNAYLQLACTMIALRRL